MIELNGVLKTSHEGLMIGNGVLGALIFGESDLTISLDRIDLWDERLPKEYKSKKFIYPYLAETLNSNYKKAYKLFDDCYNHSYPTKINAGKIITNVKVSPNDKSFIDTRTGVVSYISRNNKLTAYADAYKEIVVIDLENDFDFTFSTPKYFNKNINDNGLDYPKCELQKENSFFVLNQKMYGNREYSVVIYRNKNSLFLTIINNKNIEKAKYNLEKYSKNRDIHFKKHLLRYKNYYKQSEIVTPDLSINRLYELGRYYFLANANKKYPVTLHGVWTQNNDCLPPWKADLHNDLNVQMSYEHYLKFGNYKEGKVLLDYLVNNRKQYRENAKKFLLSDGFFIPGVTTLKGKPLGGWPQYALNLCCQIWLIKVFSEYLNYINNEDYLKDVVYPFFVEIEKGISNYLILNNGFYELGFHSSPEYFENDKKSLFFKQTNFELINLRFLYSTLIEYSKRLNITYDKYLNIFNKLHSLYKNNNGEACVADEYDLDMSHRHFSHILNYKNIKISDPFENIDYLKKDINRIEKLGTDKFVGFSYVELAGLEALANNGEAAYKYLSVFSNNFVNGNGFHMNIDFGRNIYTKMDCFVMTLEANFGFLTSLGDMMIENYRNKVCFFPALPEKFKVEGVSFKDLRITNNHKVTGKVKGKKVIIKIKMNSEDTILIKNNFKKNPIIKIDGESVKYTANLGDFIEVRAKNNVSFRGKL